MTDTPDLPDEWVEEVALALDEHLDDLDAGVCTEIAEGLLTAALPAIESRIRADQGERMAQRVEHELQDRVKNSPPSPLTAAEKRGWRLGMSYAVALIRGGTDER